MKRILIVIVAAVLFAADADAGPIRNAVARVFGGRCGGCRPAQSVQCQPVPVPQQQVQQAVYAPQPVDFRPVSLPVPACAGGVCPR